MAVNVAPLWRCIRPTWWHPKFASWSFEVTGQVPCWQADALMPDGHLVPIGGCIVEDWMSLTAALHRAAGELGGVKAVIYLTTI